MAGETAPQAAQAPTEPAKESFADMAAAWNAHFDEQEDDAHEPQCGKRQEVASEPRQDAKLEGKPDAEGSEDTELTLESLQNLAKEGKAVDILRALGVKAPEKVASKQWADFRAREKQFQDQKQQFEQVVQQLEQRFTRLDKAEKLYQGGDLLGAFAEFFGGHDKLDEITAAIVKQKGSRDPEAWREIQAMKAKEAKREEERKALEEQQRQHAEAQQIANSRAAVLQLVQKEVPAVFQAIQASSAPGDAQLVAHLLSTAARQHLEQTGEDLTAEQAIQLVADDFGRIHRILTATGSAVPGGLREQQDPGDTPVRAPDQGGQSPAQQRTRVLSPQKARSAGGKPTRTYQDSLSEYAAELGRALGAD